MDSAAREESLDDLVQESARLATLVRKRMRQDSNSSGRYYTYVLLLQDECIYVGSSNNIYTRLMSHLYDPGMSSHWVREHGPPVRILEISRNGKPGDERYKTLEYMTMFGYESVRGDAWCKVDLRNAPAPLQDFKRDRSDFEYLTRGEIDDIVSISKKLFELLEEND